jgi:DNA (cytosine-5)-methyltransferase 1
MTTFVSLFSGVGGFDLGLEAAGWECVAQVEWDKSCQSVLARHWPDVPRWGDVATVSGADLPPADVVVFGSPCQDLSVAGKRAGLDGARSGLFFEAIRIIKEMRNATNGASPRFAIWENVAGALSSSGGWDFAAVLDSLGELGAMDIAWRVLDARFFGVPQRRRRVFVVADFAGECAGAIHAERAGVPWHPRSSGTAWPQPATAVGAGVETSSQPLAVTDVVGTLSPGAHPGGFNGQDAYTGQLVVTHTHTPSPVDLVPVAPIWRTPKQVGLSASDENLAAPLLSGLRTTDIDGATWVVTMPDEVVFTKAKRATSPTDDETWVRGEVSPTLNSFDNGGDSRATVLAFHPTQTPIHGPISPALGATSGGMAVHATAIRRLTPTECERLMGWPDNHTRWRADGTELADSVRYRMCGNGVASPVAEWLADMINQALENE